MLQVKKVIEYKEYTTRRTFEVLLDHSIQGIGTRKASTTSEEYVSENHSLGSGAKMNACVCVCVCVCVYVFVCMCVCKVQGEVRTRGLMMTT